MRNVDATSRRKQGFKPGPCNQCRLGLAYGELKTFDPRCKRCAEKKALGWRTGDEPRPARDMHWRLHRMVGAEWIAFCKRLHCQSIARRTYYASQFAGRAA